MTVSTASNNYWLRNSSRIKYETIRNQTKRKHIIGKAQIMQRENILGKDTFQLHNQTKRKRLLKLA